ncbi:MAG: two-component regulator propeller domain-containing protein, partial [Bacteroidota bacterium]
MKNILFLLLCISASIGITQSYITDHQYLTTEDGLANLFTTAIFQDSKGFVWIGTRYGLNRFDGYNFELYLKQ